MEGLLNVKWQASEFSSPYVMGILRDDDLEIRFRMTTVPAYCGAMFVYDFIYSNTLMEAHRQSPPRDLSEWNNKLRYFLCLAQLYARHMRTDFYKELDSWKVEYITKAVSMDFSFWEIEDRPMYAFGMQQEMDCLQPRINPNSGNRATMFSAPFNDGSYVDMHMEYGTEWVTVLDIHGDYPDNIDGRGSDGCDGLDMEDW